LKGTITYRQLIEAKTSESVQGKQQQDKTSDEIYIGMTVAIRDYAKVCMFMGEVIIAVEYDSEDDDK
jgi:hypothetical protein